MPFHEITGITPTSLDSAEQLPVFLFPDVTGHYLSIFQFASQLQVMRKKSRIYIWHDPLISESDNMKSLSDYADQIKEQILKLYPAGPCFLGGYSFGGNLALKVAQSLELAERQAALFVIDAPSICQTQSYLQPQNKAANSDLISILNCAAQLASLQTEQKIEPLLFLSKKEQSKFNSLSSIEMQLNALKDNFTTRNGQLNPTFEHYIQTITHNLLSLLQCEEKSAPSPRLATIRICSSQESRSKYNFQIAKGWEPYCHKVEASEFPDTTHLSLIKDKASCHLIAVQMSAYFNNYFSTAAILAMLCKPWVINDPNFDMDKLIGDLEKFKLHDESKSSFHDEFNVSSQIICSPPQLSTSPGDTTPISFSLSTDHSTPSTETSRPASSLSNEAESQRDNEDNDMSPSPCEDEKNNSLDDIEMLGSMPHTCTRSRFFSPGPTRRMTTRDQERKNDSGFYLR